MAFYQILILYASWINQTSLCTYVIASAFTSLLIQFPLGIGTAAHNLVSQALQYNHFSKARKYIKISMVGGLFWASAAALTFLAFNKFFIQKVTADEEIINTFVSLAPYIAITQIFDFSQTIQFGILKGTENTTYGVVGSAFFMVILSAPLSYYLCFTLDYGFKGALIGYGVGL
mmetsp:Transcript_31853/g.28203  ORF Transcript_31853/g.28203 Transcript_31853/m.28203 type:complete len:174 (+) Transcript_31853:442-963(+)